MSSNVTDYGAGFLLGVISRQETMPSTLYLALTTATPDVGWDGTLLADVEPVDINYARKSFTNSSAFWDAPADGLMVSLSAVLFDAADSDYLSEVTHYAMCTALTAGEVLFYGEFSESKPISAGQQPEVIAGLLSLGLAGPPLGELSQ